MPVGTTALILAGLTAAQTATSAISSRNAVRGAKQQGALEGGMYDTAARDALARGEEAANQVGSQSRVLTGAQRTALAAQGIDITTGSAADVQSSDQRTAQLNEGQLRLNAAREAFGFTEQGMLARMGASNAAKGYSNQMYSTLLGGAASLYGQYRAFGENKVPRIKPATGGTSVGAQIRGVNL